MLLSLGLLCSLVERLRVQDTSIIKIPLGTTLSGRLMYRKQGSTSSLGDTKTALAIDLFIWYYYADIIEGICEKSEKQINK